MLLHFQRGAGLLDTRSKAAYVQAYILGSVHLEADPQLSNRIGFVFPPEAPIILLLANPADYERVAYSLARVSYENVIGYLAEGLNVWESMGLPIKAGNVKDIEPSEPHNILEHSTDDCPIVVDENLQGYKPGAILMPLRQLSTRLAELNPEHSVAVIFANGIRSQSAAARLEQKGFKTTYNVVGGTGAWIYSGLPLTND